MGGRAPNLQSTHEEMVLREDAELDSGHFPPLYWSMLGHFLDELDGGWECWGSVQVRESATSHTAARPISLGFLTLAKLLPREGRDMLPVCGRDMLPVCVCACVCV